MRRLHAFPQPPQLVASLRVSTSHPFDAWPSQSANPPEHAAIAHAPAAHVGVALASEHALPQPPQFAGSDRTSTSHPSGDDPSQSANPVAHAPIAHAPDVHAAPAFGKLHACPHEPHDVTVEVRSTSHPLPFWPSQFPHPVWHTPMTHAPVAHPPLACWGAHTAPHAPQLVAVARLVSHPFDAT